MRAIKSNLKDQILCDDDSILFCPRCVAEYSANRGDYFLLPEDHVFICPDCEMEMVLAKRRVVYECV